MHSFHPGLHRAACQFGFLPWENPASQLVPACADRGGKPHKRSHRGTGNVCTVCLICHVENAPQGQKPLKQDLWFCGFLAQRSDIFDKSVAVFSLETGECRMATDTLHFIKMELSRAPLFGCNPSGSEGPGHPCSARWLSSQTSQKHLSTIGDKKVQIYNQIKLFFLNVQVLKKLSDKLNLKLCRVSSSVNY